MWVIDKSFEYHIDFSSNMTANAKVIDWLYCLLSFVSILAFIIHSVAILYIYFLADQVSKIFILCCNCNKIYNLFWSSVYYLYKLHMVTIYKELSGWAMGNFYLAILLTHCVSSNPNFATGIPLVVTYLVHNGTWIWSE